MHLKNKIKEAAATGYILLWLLGGTDSNSALDLSLARLHVNDALDFIQVPGFGFPGAITLAEEQQGRV